MKISRPTTSYLQQPMTRYFIIAFLVVCIELAIFTIMNVVLDLSYLIATPLSNIIAILLNWYFSRTFVFRNGSNYKQHVEIFLIFVVSIIGIGLQLIVSYVSVEILYLSPILGKILSIIVVFFWSYWSRKRFIFKT